MLDGGFGEGDFYWVKLCSVDFYLWCILLWVSMYCEVLFGGVDCLMVLFEEYFLF